MNSYQTCNRLVKCNYHYSPKQYFEDNGHLIPTFDRKITYQRPIILPKLEPDFISKELFEKSFSKNQPNNFISYKRSLFHDEVTDKLIEKYKIATSKHWQGSTIFWQIDSKGNVRSGKIMLYDAKTGKRVKEPFNHFTWVHSVLQKQKIIKDFNLQQCFFGEHLLAIEPKDKILAIVESEKTAILASVFLPEFLWLAVGSLTNLTLDRCEVLAGRSIILYHDLGNPDVKGRTPFDKWTEKAELFIKNLSCNVSVSDILEQVGTDEQRNNGFDIADYFIKKGAQFGWALTDDDYPKFWDL